ncbi:haloacid dehalogenase [Cadophora sp. MPI-SDFR-AT-0126]|nr:haloacid dehalogenase [Leotiomycetes sp. MPI-SDFR-AT-0126]
MTVVISPVSNLKAVIFDLMGTCCDWHSSIVPALQSSPPTPLLPSSSLPNLATDWRAVFFQEIHLRFEAGLPAEDIDATHRRVLNRLLEEELMRRFGGRTLARCFAWVDEVAREVFRVRVVLVNGTTRLQLDIAKSSGLPFHALFSSQLLGLTKPDPEIYRKLMEVMKVEPDECLMVAAHAYDLRAAKKVGKWHAQGLYSTNTEDLDENMAGIRAEVDMFLDGTKGDEHCGIAELANRLDLEL